MRNCNQDSTKLLHDWVIRGLFILAMLAACLVATVSHVTAQSSSVIWSPPENISNTPQSSAYPAVVADDLGYVHVFWSEDIDGQPLGPSDQSDSGNAIYYTRWDGTVWTQPVDILYSPDEPVASYPAVAADKKGNVHLVWTGVTDIYYSQAPAWQAESANAWRPPIVIATDSARSAWESSIAVDNEGNVHIAYATRGGEPGIYYVVSTDNGVTWSQPARLSQPFDMLEMSLSGVRLIVDGANRLHVIWQTNDTEGMGQSAYYVRSTDGGKTWSSPYQLGYRQAGDFFVGYPYILSVGSEELHIIYVAGANKGRWERVSRDGGATWSGPQHIIPEMEGINGYVIPVVDSVGQLHLIINMRPTATQQVGIYYSSWQGNGWSPVTPLSNNGPKDDSAHFMAAAILLGHEIHIVWNQVRGGEIWHMRGVIDNAKPLPAQDLPAPQQTPSLTPTAAVVPFSNTNVVRPLVNPYIPENVNTAGNSPLVPGAIAAVVFIMTFIIGMLWRQSRGRAR